MKKQLQILGIILASITSSPLFGEDQAELFCVDMNRIIITPSGIWIESDGLYYEAETIIFNKLENKYYAKTKKPKWKCGNCGKYNDPKRENCWYCGWPWGPPGPDDYKPN